MSESEWTLSEGEGRGIELTVAESIALWEFFQSNECPPAWVGLMSSVYAKAKSFHRYGPWE